jgi:fumarylpyruvate hydrolase
MATLCFPAEAQALLSVAGEERQFPVHRIYCVGRNYAEHAREMGATQREEPFFFCKPADAVVPIGDQESPIPYPGLTDDFQHEIELVVALGGEVDGATPDRARSAIWGYAVGLDLTRRDLQAGLKRAGRPWEISKAFDGSAPVSQIRPRGEVGLLGEGRIWLDVNGMARQRGDLSEMIWNIEETIAQLSRYFRLRPGDLVFTGTPAGVGRLMPGDLLEGGIEHVGRIRARITSG